MTGAADGRLFAVVPAAGHSRRMGRPKLLLPLAGRSVVGRLIDALSHPRLAAIVVVARQDDDALAREVEGTRATLLQPKVDPPDMRASVEYALDFLERIHHPQPDDGWLLIPADHPLLDPKSFEELVGAWDETTAPVLVPTHAGRRGHPVFFRWGLVDEVRKLPADRGLNALVANHEDEVLECLVDDPGILVDVDTPADFEQVQRRFGGAD